jgi:serine/threonine protein kinase
MFRQCISDHGLKAKEAEKPTPVSPSAGKERRLGDYRILREIGRGGMGVVYEAEQVSLGRRVAFKVLSGTVANDRMALERFRREAKAAARLHHTRIVPVFEVGRAGRSVDGRIPRDLETIVPKAIEKDPKARYQSAEALAEDLRRFLADEPIRARQASAWERY